MKPYKGGADQPEAFKLPPATAVDFCTVDGGASINCPSATIVAHSNGTHTECVGHALPGRITLADIRPPPVALPAVLLTVTPLRLAQSGDEYSSGHPEDLVIGEQTLRQALAKAASDTSVTETDLVDFVLDGAIVVRTLPNDDSKRTRRWGGSGAPFFTPAAMSYVRSMCQHLVCDLPSVDKEDDGGLLLAHRAFWGLPPRGASLDGYETSSATITELAYIPPAGPAGTGPEDGPYVLSLQVAPIELDAAPSRPLLFPVRRGD